MSESGFKSGGKVYYVVKADYGDDWENQDKAGNEWMWSVAGDDSSRRGYRGGAFYESRSEAERRANCILDHATKIEEWSKAEVDAFLEETQPVWMEAEAT